VISSLVHEGYQQTDHETCWDRRPPMSRPYNGGNCKSCSSKAHVLGSLNEGYDIGWGRVDSDPTD